MLSRMRWPIVARPLTSFPVSSHFVSPIYARRTLATSTAPASEPVLNPTTESNATTASPSSAEPAETDVPTTSTRSADQNQPAQLPYFVGRNLFNNLSIYHKSKRGGNLKLTVLKRGEGNLQVLKQDLKSALQLREGDISVNSVTKHLVIKGHKSEQVANFLITLGF
ncbi:mitochondrial large subunit ribosomal protein-domain-containing protein [Xylariomycetidae sp. FL2044]|nr:mitochondrial large subunit ribosomal protein-domain-containing protein [Xylariomycetidae sp. FL2044]